MNNKTETFMPDQQIALNNYNSRKNKDDTNSLSYCIKCKNYVATDKCNQLSLNEYICFECL